MIRFEDYGWRFESNEEWTLQDINLEIRPHEIVAITGASGCGKSTLALAVAALLNTCHVGQTHGAVYLKGREITQAHAQAAAGVVGLVQQNPDVNFATLEVEDELTFALENRCLESLEIDRRIQEVIELLELEPLRNRLIATLSEGQKQRVAVAAALAAHPQVLILDEPTAHLDPGATDCIIHTLHELVQKRSMTVVIIEQKLIPLRHLKPRIILISNHTITADYPWADIPDTLKKELCPIPYSSGVPQTFTQKAPLEIKLVNSTVRRESHKILDNISLQIKQGEIVALMGPNGSGKSSLLLSLLGLIDLQGDIACLGQKDIMSCSTFQLSEQTGLVFQNPDHQLFADTVMKEVTFAGQNFGRDEEHIRTRAEEKLQLVGLGTYRNEHPYRLSYGQKRRLNVIAAILHDIELLLLDEPFVGQDPQNIKWLISMTRQLSTQQVAVIMVIHDPYLVEACCNRVIFLESRRVLVDAPVSEAWETLRQSDYAAYTPVVTAEEKTWPLL